MKLYIWKFYSLFLRRVLNFNYFVEVDVQASRLAEFFLELKFLKFSIDLLWLKRLKFGQILFLLLH